jgi:O-succinylbenzoic acid--CoA ligase
VTTFSVFDAAREQPHAVALVDGDEPLTFAEAAHRTAPLARALAAARPPALALTPRADTESLLWLYAAFATGTPLVLLHQRAAAAERARIVELTSAVAPPAPVEGGPELPLPLVSESATLVVLPTSGSTGEPRLVKLSRRALAASAHASARHLGWEAADRWLLCLPLAHTGGLSVVTRCLLARRPVVLFEPGPDGLLARVPDLQQALARATLVSLVPSILAALLDAGFVPAPALRAVLLGGAGCAPELARRAHAAGVPLLTSYGLTETSSQVVTRRYAERYEPLPVRDGVVSSGHPLPGVTLRLESGIISVHSGSLLSGYVGQSGPSLDERGFFVTSDRGELGGDGELYVRGRSDDVIVTGGENVDPLEVEAALLALPGVLAACVFGTPSEKFGEVVTALLVTDDPKRFGRARVAELLEGRLARHKLPRRVLLTDALPLGQSGKVDRRACRALFAASQPEA